MLNVDDAWIVFHDVYRERHYGAIRSRDLKTWEAVAVAFPAGARHGTAFAVPAALASVLR